MTADTAIYVILGAWNAMFIIVGCIVLKYVR